MPNVYEELGRRKKADTLADFLADQGCTAAMAEAMDQEQWRAIAKHARVNMPSPLTQVLVIERLRKVRVLDTGSADELAQTWEAPR